MHPWRPKGILRGDTKRGPTGCKTDFSPACRPNEKPGFQVIRELDRQTANSVKQLRYRTLVTFCHVDRFVPFSSCRHSLAPLVSEEWFLCVYMKTSLKIYLYICFTCHKVEQLQPDLAA